MRQINPRCNVITYPFFIDDRSIDEMAIDYDFIVEATDNVESRYRVNDSCVRLGKPFCIGGVSHYSGQVLICEQGSTSYRDVFPHGVVAEERPLPILSPVVGMLGTIMATEIVKYLIGIGNPLVNRMLTFDAFAMTFNVFDITKQLI